MVDHGSAARFDARFPVPGTIEVTEAPALDPSAGSNVIPSSLSSTLIPDCSAVRQNLTCLRNLTAAIATDMNSRQNTADRLATAKAEAADDPSATRFGDGGSGGSWHTVQAGRHPVIASHCTCPSSFNMLTPSLSVPFVTPLD